MNAFEQVQAYCDVLKFFTEHKDRLFRFGVYKRRFTPYEMANRFSDESIYEDDTATMGYVRDVVILPDGDVLLGIAIVTENNADLQDENWHIDYYVLSELRINFYPKDGEAYAGA